MAQSIRGFASATAASVSSQASGALSVDPVTGDGVVVMVQYVTGVSISTVGDNVGGSPNTYTAVEAARGTDTTRVRFYYCPNVTTTAGFSVTATFSGVTDRATVHVVAVQNMKTTSPLGVFGGAQQSSTAPGTDVFSSGNVGTPSADNHICLALFSAQSQPDPGTLTAGTGWTAISTRLNGYSTISMYRVQTTAAAVIATASLSVGQLNAQGVMEVASFAEAAAGTSGPTVIVGSRVRTLVRSNGFI